MKSEDGCVGGDGGPLIVLQASAIALWQGASDFNNSLMSGGNVETDYDVICQCEKEVTLIKRYDRDMLVLWDSEWGGHIIALPSGEIIITQGCFDIEELPDLSNRQALGNSLRSFPSDIQDTSLRLLVGADDGNGKTWEYSDVDVIPRVRNCDVYSSGEYYVVIMK